MDAKFIVVFKCDDFTFPMGWDDECEGAIEAVGADKPIAGFASRTLARKAIRISTANAKLREQQGKPVNADFLGEDRKCLKIYPITRAEQPQ